MSDSAATPSSSGNSTSQEESNTTADQGHVKNSTASPPPEENKNSTASPPPEENKTSSASPPPAPNNSSATPSTPSAPSPQPSDRSPTPPAAPSNSTPPAASSNNPAPTPAASNSTPQASPSPPSPGDGGGGGSTPAVTPVPGQSITNPPALPPPQNVKSPPSPTNTSGSPSAPVTGSPPSTTTFLPTVPPPSQSPGTPAPSKSNRTSSSTTNDSSKSQRNVISGNNLTEKDKAIIGLATAGALLITVGILFFLIKRSKKRNPSAPSVAGAQTDDYFYVQNAPKEKAGLKDGFHGALMQNESQRGGGVYHGLMKLMSNLGGSTSVFSYEEVKEMTNGFSHENVIGEGGFGCVFKGFLHDGKPVAVKQLKSSSGQGEREFRAEVEIISRVHHRYLVSLVGYCISQEERLLIYEFVPNNNLEHHLHGDGIPVLEWSKRLKIAIGAAKGLAYLHDDCHPKIIHRDIKSANILLDDTFEALVADFGLARLSSDTSTHVSTRVMGTFGYMAPEYASSGKLTDKSDVFSFGVVLLELVTGRKPVDPEQPSGDESLVEWARPLLIRAVESGDFSELVDPRLEKDYVDSEMSRMVEAAAACVRHSAPKRPRMIQVVRALDSNVELSDLSNGVSYGQSRRYDSAQYNQDMQRFRRVAFDSSEDMYSGEYGSRSDTLPPPSLASSSTESESRSLNIDRSGGIRS